MTVNLNEIASLVQQLQSHMDDAGNKITRVDISSQNHARVHIDSILFLTEFPRFEINCLENPSHTFPYRLSASIGGVEFLAVMSAAEIVDLETSMPDQWMYIQKKVQAA